MIHQIIYKDNNGDVSDVDYFCNNICTLEMINRLLEVIPLGNWEHSQIPTHPETDCDIHCMSCKEPLWNGIEQNRTPDRQGDD